MPFIRAKQVKTHTYSYLCECVWKDGKPRQRVLCYLSRHETVKAAHAYWQMQVKAGEDAADRKHAREMVKKLAQYL